MIDLFSNSKEPGWTWPVTVALLATILLAGGPAFAQVDVVQTLLLSRAPVSSPPPAVLSESFIVTAPPAPTAIAILLPGGAGLVGLAPNGTGGGTLDVNSHNFVVRSRCLFAGHNLYTITLDAATDFYLLGGLAGYEGSAAHVSDILTVIAWARSTMPGLPVWIVGTSRGTGGAFVAGSYSPAQGGPDGLVFAASLNSKTDRDSLLMANLAGITVPALLINDAGSTCSIASTAGEKPVLKALTQSPRKGIEQVASGKLTALTGNCDALSDHGFFGIEDTAVSDIAVWMAILPATADPGQRYLRDAGGRHDQCSEDVHPDQRPDRNADQHRDLDDRRFCGVGDDLHDEPGGQGQMYDQRDVHADGDRDQDGGTERER
jgi:hypothetical protein